MKNRIVSLAFILSSSTSCALAQMKPPPLEANQSDLKYELKKVVDDVSVPWSMLWLNSSDMLITDREGHLRMVRDGKLLSKRISNVPKVDARNQGGLLDLEKHPDYETTGWIYISYSGFEGEGQGSNTSLIRAKLDKKQMALTDIELLFEASPNTSNSRHYGSRIEFDKEGHLFLSVGDRGERDRFPQDLGADAGKIHRLNADGSIPSDNPFVSKSGVKQSIYSYGHRNPQGMAMHPETGDIWAHEHGPRGGDEINLLNAGTNYGWPVISYGINYNGTAFTDETSKEGMAQPKWQWTPSIAPSAMVFVSSEKYPEWQNNMLVGSLKFSQLVLVELDDNKVVGHSSLFEGIGRVRSLSISPDGYLFVGVDGQGIFKVEPK